MPPKAKGKGILIEGVDTTEMTFPQLQQYMMQIYEKLLKEREERNYFQLERDKLRTFWELTRRQLDEARAEIRNKDYALELAEQQRQHDLREIKQQVKYLIYEQSLQANEWSVKEKNSLLAAAKDYAEQELELLTDKKELKNKLKALEEHQLNENKTLRLTHAKEITDIRTDFEKKTDETEYKFDKKLTTVRVNLDLKQRLELSEVEERKNYQIKMLTDNNKMAFDDIRNYYNNITLNNFSLISNLKENIEDMKRKEAAKDKHLKEVLKENKLVSEILQKSSQEIEQLKHQLSTYKKETIRISSMKREMNKAKRSLDKLKWDYDILNLRFQNNTEEKNKTEATKMIQVIELQREVGGRLSYLEEKLKAIKNQVERRDNLINDIRNLVSTSRQLGGQVLREVVNLIATYDESRTRRLTHRQSLLFGYVQQTPSHQGSITGS